MIEKIKDKRFLVSIILFFMVCAILFFFMIRKQSNDFEYMLFDVSIGDIEKTVSCTGTINAKGSVEVGSQISGTISSLYADYNDTVHAGMKLAVLDTLLLAAEYSQSVADMNRANNKMILSRKEYESAIELYDKKLISNNEFLTYKTNYLIDSADFQSAKSKMEKAKVNINYAIIKSPIDGVVIDRNVEVGQTVAANFTTPTFFLIAENLSKLEILVSVDESDIGSIKVGQNACFTVNAYPDSTFWGDVVEVRKKPTVLQNVVNYVVVVDTENKNNLLLPGMTATVDFIIEQKRNVLLAPIAAVRFKPPEDVEKRFHERMRKKMSSMADGENHDALRRDTAKGDFPPPPPMPGSGVSFPDNVAQIWYFDEEGALTMELALTGASDGSSIELVKCKNLKEGVAVVTGVKKKLDIKENNSRKQSNQLFGPSSPQPGGGGGPPPGGR
ncbi:efflux RND transporter periplasmic adaptor subunit [Prosthecochloris sp. SCSIO W1103]|uniref:efflux RND transporter periplasmic adaptor subunit n=1 Tax=Prosthecochloris sp. SCSIO W1103 TaxID=2992244 RepID=UPI00223D7DA6|nr:efflux RND transporter periplasmic adaptor subunit [Prosthecochloris sp. SCSIO W1103]UZJ37229.1 efflux RND transporter periplasmic adaptor subunit [Prosthecochloris sp. SCSIO W1103]